MPQTQKKATNALGRKIGPLPLWAWGGLVAVLGVVGYIYLRNRSGASPGSSDGGVTILGGGGQVAPLAAQSGAPSENSAPAAGLSSDVLSTLTGLQSDIAGVGFAEAADANTNSLSLATLQTSLDSQATKLDAVTSQVASLTLSDKTPPAITIQNMVPKMTTAPPAKTAAKTTHKPIPTKPQAKKPAVKTKVKPKPKAKAKR